MIDLKNIASNMKTFRQEKGYSLKKLSEESGISETAIVGWEQARRSPNLFSLMCVCDVLNCTVDEYIRGKSA